jgi:hypothetical protein
MFHTVYEFSDKIIKLTFLFPLSIAIIGLLAFFYNRHIKDNTQVLGRFKTRTGGMIWGLFFFFGAGFISCGMALSSYNQFEITKEVFNHRRYSATEGVIQGYKTFSESGGKNTVLQGESFYVNNINFSYYENDTDYGYHKPYASGGVIRPELTVRIGYFYNGEKNVIVKIEMARDNP